MSFQSSFTENQSINVSDTNVKRGAERCDRKCEIPNYLPHKTPEHGNRESWHNAYKEQLVDIYKNVRDIINSEFPKNKIVWDNTAINNLSRVIYYCSSKYISPYIETNSYSDLKLKIQ